MDSPLTAYGELNRASSAPLIGGSINGRTFLGGMFGWIKSGVLSPMQVVASLRGLDLKRERVRRPES
jgi:hypothetical protein